MGTAIGPALIYFMTNGPAVIAAVNPGAVVTLGWPDDVADDVMVFGRTLPDDSQAEVGTQAYVELGAQRVDEAFDLPFFIGCGRGGDDQTEAMLAAVAMFDAFFAFLRTDLTLGGALHDGRIAQITSHRMRATQDTREAKQGRRWLITATVTCKNRY